VGAGIGKASTGYAFDAIQRDSERIVEAIGRGGRRPAPPRSAFSRWLDLMMVGLLRERPEVGPAVFGRLFARAEPERVVRFLTDSGGVLDALAVMRAVPKRAMIRRVASSVGGLR
jgi:lycopene beta-cyclase